jgi:8-oxo-dGTP diphosphatase
MEMNNLKIAVAGIIEKEGQVLIGKKRKTDNHFLSERWHLPGGKVDSGESEEEALKREMFEEANLDIEVVKLIDEVIMKDHNYKVIWYLCRALNDDLNPGDDLEEVKFVPKKEAKNYCSQTAVSLWPEKVKEYLEAE